MAVSERWFYRGTEGFLGDEANCKLLFLMREPNCGKGQLAPENYFWFKHVVHGEKLKLGDCYLSKLGRIAALITDSKEASINEGWVSALQRAIYININPVSGEGVKSDDYREALENFGKGPRTDCYIQGNSYTNRWTILLNLPDESVIVTTGDIYTVMHDWLKESGAIIPESAPLCLTIRTPRGECPMNSFVFTHKGKKITVMETYHPASRGKNSFQWNNITIQRNNFKR